MTASDARPAAGPAPAAGAEGPTKVTAAQLAAIFDHPCANPSECPACQERARQSDSRMLEVWAAWAEREGNAGAAALFRRVRARLATPAAPASRPGAETEECADTLGLYGCCEPQGHAGPHVARGTDERPLVWWRNRGPARPGATPVSAESPLVQALADEAEQEDARLRAGAETMRPEIAPFVYAIDRAAERQVAKDMGDDVRLTAAAQLLAEYDRRLFAPPPRDRAPDAAVVEDWLLRMEGWLQEPCEPNDRANARMALQGLRDALATPKLSEPGAEDEDTETIRRRLRAMVGWLEERLPEFKGSDGAFYMLTDIDRLATLRPPAPAGAGEDETLALSDDERDALDMAANEYLPQLAAWARDQQMRNYADDAQEDARLLRGYLARARRPAADTPTTEGRD